MSLEPSGTDELTLIQRLVQAAVASAEVLHAARRVAQDRGVSFIHVVSQLEGVDEERVARVIARYTQTPRLCLEAESIELEQVGRLFSLEQLIRLEAVPIRLGPQGELLMGVTDPSWEPMLSELSAEVPHRLLWHTISRRELRAAIARLQEHRFESSLVFALPGCGSESWSLEQRLQAAEVVERETRELEVLSPEELEGESTLEDGSVEEVAGRYAPARRLIEVLGAAESGVERAFALAEAGIRLQTRERLLAREITDALSLVYRLVLLLQHESGQVSVSSASMQGRELPMHLRPPRQLHASEVFWRPLLTQGLLYHGVLPDSDALLHSFEPVLEGPILLLPLSCIEGEGTLLLLGGEPDQPFPSPGHALLTFPKSVDAALRRVRSHRP